MSSCRVGEHSRYELVLAVVRYILIDGHVLRNSGSRVEILKMNLFLSIRCYIIQMSLPIFSKTGFQNYLFAVTKLNIKVVFLLFCELHAQTLVILC